MVGKGVLVCCMTSLRRWSIDCLVPLIILHRQTPHAHASRQSVSLSGRLTSGKGYPALAYCVRPVIRSYLQWSDAIWLRTRADRSRTTRLFWSGNLAKWRRERTWARMSAREWNSMATVMVTQNGASAHTPCGQAADKNFFAWHLTKDKDIAPLASAILAKYRQKERSSACISWLKIKALRMGAAIAFDCACSVLLSQLVSVDRRPCVVVRRAWSSTRSRTTRA